MRSTRLQLLQWATAIVIAVLLGIHIAITHLHANLGFFGVTATEPASWESMIGRASQGIWVGLYIVLLAVVLYHALYGLRGIILELTPSPRTGRIVTWVLIAFGIIFFGGGTYVPVYLLAS